VGAPRPAASPFLADDHCARYGVRAQSFTPGENDPFRCRRWLWSRRAEVARRPIGKKIAFVQRAAERRRYFLCIQHGAQESNISPFERLSERKIAGKNRRTLSHEEICL
jgi:hypothetical protein